MWNRKIVTASIASPVYAILLACGVTMAWCTSKWGNEGCAEWLPSDDGCLCDGQFSDHVDLRCRDPMVQ